MELKKNTVVIEGKTIRYQTIGIPTGEPIVLIHGLSGSSRWWKYNIAPLAEKYLVYLIDLPGFGTMRGSINRLDLEKTADWVVALLDALAIKKAHIIGHSMGGYVCISLAAKYPKRVDKLVLVSSIGIPNKQTFVNSALPLLKAMFYVTPKFLPVLVVDALRAGPFSLLFAAQEIFKVDAREKLQKISSQTLLLWGANDTLVPPKCAQAMKQLIKNSKLVLLRYASHVPMYDEPLLFNKTVLKFLEK